MKKSIPSIKYFLLKRKKKLTPWFTQIFIRIKIFWLGSEFPCKGMFEYFRVSMRYNGGSIKG